jgi:hypothetical protein
MDQRLCDLTFRQFEVMTQSIGYGLMVAQIAIFAVAAMVGRRLYRKWVQRSLGKMSSEPPQLVPFFDGAELLEMASTAKCLHDALCTDGCETEDVDGVRRCASGRRLNSFVQRLER